MSYKNIELRNNIIFLSVILIVIASFFLDYNIYKDKIMSKKSLYNIDSELSAEVIQQRTLMAVKALKFLNFKLLQNVIHPKLGVRVSPYPYILSSDKILFAHEVKQYYDNDIQYNWGYDSDMNPIILTFKEYYNRYIYNQDFANYDEISFNKELSNPTKMVDNTREFYINAIIVELKINGVLPENQGKDWTILRLVFDNYKDNWYLIAIVNLRGIIATYDHLSQ